MYYMYYIYYIISYDYFSHHQIQDVVPISSYDTAGSFLLLGCENGSIYYIGEFRHLQFPRQVVGEINLPDTTGFPQGIESWNVEES